MPNDQVFIGGEWVDPATDRTIEVVSPTTEAVIGSVAEATEADVDRAVAVARTAFEAGGWNGTSADERADAIGAVGAAIMERGEELAAQITAEVGTPSKWSMAGQVLSAMMVLNGYADACRAYPFERQRPGMLGQPVDVRQVPVGVAAGIAPFNVPVFIMVNKLGPAIAAGCPVVIKASPETALTAQLFADVLAGVDLPSGAVSVLVGDREASEHLVRHPDVALVGFTGSVPAGRAIGRLCGEQLKACLLELGGKSAAIVLPDVDFEAQLPALVQAGLLNNGEACGAQTRLLFPRVRYDELVDALGAHVGGLVVGDPADPETDVGPLISARQRDRVVGYLETGVSEGATVVTGGGTPAALDQGWFVQPTVFGDVKNSMRIAREEIFGPVLSVIPYDDEDEAVAIANDSDFGLCGSVWSGDLEHALEVGARLRTGCVAVNSEAILDLNSPFGGFKQSGLGREHGPEGIAEYLEHQALIHPFT